MLLAAESDGTYSEYSWQLGFIAKSREKGTVKKKITRKNREVLVKLV